MNRQFNFVMSQVLTNCGLDRNDALFLIVLSMVQLCNTVIIDFKVGTYGFKKNMFS